jgi:hypothetical protein
VRLILSGNFFRHHRRRFPPAPRDELMEARQIAERTSVTTVSIVVIVDRHVGVQANEWCVANGDFGHHHRISHTCGVFLAVP